MHRTDHLSPVDERELVDRARTDPEAFAVLYRHHLPAVHMFLLRRTGSVPVAEDLTAATFEKALRSLTTYSTADGRFGAWLHRIAANHLTDHHRRLGREHSHSARAAMRQVSDGSAFATVGADPDGDLGRLRTALDALNDRYRTVLSLRYFSELDHDGAVAASGLSRSHFAVVLHRAKAALKRELERTEALT